MKREHQKSGSNSTGVSWKKILQVFNGSGAKMRKELIGKLIRVPKYWLPVASNRRGKCIGCGACCKLVINCPFLKYDENGKARCRIYPIRFLGCRKYPRTEKDWVTKDTCGFYFVHEEKEKTPPKKLTPAGNRHTESST